MSSLLWPCAATTMSDLPSQLSVYPRRDLAKSFAICSDFHEHGSSSSDPAPTDDEEVLFDTPDNLFDDRFDDLTAGLEFDEDDDPLPEPGDFWLEPEEEEE